MCCITFVSPANKFSVPDHDSELALQASLSRVFATRCKRTNRGTCEYLQISSGFAIFAHSPWKRKPHETGQPSDHKRERNKQTTKRTMSNDFHHTGSSDSEAGTQEAASSGRRESNSLLRRIRSRWRLSRERLWIAKTTMPSSRHTRGLAIRHEMRHALNY